MLSKRVIACLDVFDNKVVKGVKFRNHEIMGTIEELSKRYEDQGVDELVFYDIGASAQNQSVSKNWVKKVRQSISLPFCVAGGIKTVEYAKEVLLNGADKISINSPALLNPDLINQLAENFGSQCVVIGIDCQYNSDQQTYEIYKFTGIESKTQKSELTLFNWAKEVCDRGAGEIVLNYMSKDGTKSGFEQEVTGKLAETVSVPVIASGGAGNPQHFIELFQNTQCSGGLAAGMFHRNEYTIDEVKTAMANQGIEVRR